MIIAVEEVIVFSWPKGNGSKNELNLNLQKLLLSVTIKHNSDTNNLILVSTRLPAASKESFHHRGSGLLYQTWWY